MKEFFGCEKMGDELESGTDGLKTLESEDKSEGWTMWLRPG